MPGWAPPIVRPKCVQAGAAGQLGRARANGGAGGTAGPAERRGRRKRRPARGKQIVARRPECEQMLIGLTYEQQGRKVPTGEVQQPAVPPRPLLSLTTRAQGGRRHRDRRRQLASSGVRVNSISPDPIDTPRHATWADDLEQAYQWLSSQVPPGRIGAPEEVAVRITLLLELARVTHDRRGDPARRRSGH
jgi:NAD(P)-dependent dehydrogenase (short-subunit alcohol dehydrogenase family)